MSFYLWNNIHEASVFVIISPTKKQTTYDDRRKNKTYDSNHKTSRLVKSNDRFDKNKYVSKCHCLYFDSVRKKNEKVIIYRENNENRCFFHFRGVDFFLDIFRM